jgi:hypothetical protein
MAGALVNVRLEALMAVSINSSSFEMWHGVVLHKFTDVSKERTSSSVSKHTPRKQVASKHSVYS